MLHVGWSDFYIFIILLCELWLRCRGDLFSATYNMEYLLETRQRVIEDLEDYIHKEENRIRDIKLYLNSYTREQERAMRDVPSYVGNPINAFTLIKRLTADLDDIQELTNITTEFVRTRNVTVGDNNTSILYPTSEDLKGAALALKRLQKTYKMKVEDLSKGILNGTIYRTPLLASDCHKLSSILLQKKDYKNALSWQMEAFRKFKLEKNLPQSVNQSYIMEYIAVLHYRMSDPMTATEWTLKVLELEPNSKRARSNLIAYEQAMAENELPLLNSTSVIDETGDNMTETEHNEITNDTDETQGNIISVQNATATENEINIKKNGKYTVNDKVDSKEEYLSNTNVTKNKTEEIEVDAAHLSETTPEDNNTYEEFIESAIEYRTNLIMYEALCRGEYEIAPELTSRLFCRYRNDKPFLKLAPIKMEQKYIEPDVFLFYDVISDDEIEHVKRKAKSLMKRAVVGGGIEHNSGTPTDFRISQSGWVTDKESSVVATLSQRISDYTGLDAKHAEHLQVANYGIGGQYEPHVDWFDALFVDEHPGVNRIATSMFYMSEVSQGGATVFPKLGLSVFPVKGAAIFWYNLLRSGEGNPNTIHAACPVLEGSKWVSNKWIAMKGQEYLRPCSSEHQKETKVSKPETPLLKAEVES